MKKDLFQIRRQVQSHKGNYEDYEWFLKQDFSKYNSQWIAIINKKVISHGKNLKLVFSISKKIHPNKVPIVAKINGGLRT